MQSNYLVLLLYFNLWLLYIYFVTSNNASGFCQKNFGIRKSICWVYHKDNFIHKQHSKILRYTTFGLITNKYDTVIISSSFGNLKCFEKKFKCWKLCTGTLASQIYKMIPQLYKDRWGNTFVEQNYFFFCPYIVSIATFIF